MPGGIIRGILFRFSATLKFCPAKQASGGAAWWLAAPRGRDHPHRLTADCVRSVAALSALGPGERPAP